MKIYSLPIEYDLICVLKKKDFSLGLFNEIISNIENLPKSLQLYLINRIQDGSQNPLILAAKRNFDFVIQQLLEKNADPSVKDRYGNTALIYAIKNNCLLSVKLLTQKEVVNNENYYQQSPLMIAALSHQIDCIKILLSNGADPFSVDQYKVTTLMASLGCLEAIEIFLTKAPMLINLQDIYGQTALIKACKDLTTIDNAAILLNAGADPNVKDIYGRTALHYLVRLEANDLNNIKTLRKTFSLLMARGSDWTIKDEYNKTAYDYATDMFKDILGCTLSQANFWVKIYNFFMSQNHQIVNKKDYSLEL